MGDFTKLRDGYIRNIKSILSNGKDSASKQRAMSDAVGGSYDTIGYLEKSLLKQHGLKASDFLVDVGCGSGRLLSQLGTDDIARYLGTDISQDLLDYSEQYLKNEDWNLEKVESCSVPLADDSADMMCMFSVITHLMHHESYLYFQEAGRILKKGGRLVVSFLEFRHEELWPIFERSQAALENEGRLDIFIDRDGLRLWGEKSGLKVVSFFDGEKPHIKIDREVTFDNGLKAQGMSRLGPVGQSVVVLEKI
jgi:ubiquinone/menaquinone biosynthesis C-methylase UbiE